MDGTKRNRAIFTITRFLILILVLSCVIVAPVQSRSDKLPLGIYMDIIGRFTIKGSIENHEWRWDNSTKTWQGSILTIRVSGNVKRTWQKIALSPDRTQFEFSDRTRSHQALLPLNVVIHGGTIHNRPGRLILIKQFKNSSLKGNFYAFTNENFFLDGKSPASFNVTASIHEAPTLYINSFILRTPKDSDTGGEKDLLVSPKIRGSKIKARSLPDSVKVETAAYKEKSDPKTPKSYFYRFSKAFSIVGLLPSNAITGKLQLVLDLCMYLLILFFFFAFISSRLTNRSLPFLKTPPANLKESELNAAVTDIEAVLSNTVPSKNKGLFFSGALLYLALDAVIHSGVLIYIVYALTRFSWGLNLIDASLVMSAIAGWIAGRRLTFVSSCCFAGLILGATLVFLICI